MQTIFPPGCPGPAYAHGRQNEWRHSHTHPHLCLESLRLSSEDAGFLQRLTIGAAAGLIPLKYHVLNRVNDCGV